MLCAVKLFSRKGFLMNRNENSKIENQNIQEFPEILHRYMDLFPIRDKKIVSHIQAANIYLQLASQDVGTLHQRYISKSLSIDAFYQLMVKVDTLLDTFICLTKLLNFWKEIKVQSKKDGSQGVIDDFLALRSLSIAHPLTTNRHKDFNGTVWLEDVVDLNNDGYSSLFDKEKYNEADFLLKKICYQGEDLSFGSFQNQPINLDEEVFVISRIIEDKMGVVNQYLLNKISEKEIEYKQNKIELSKEFKFNDFKVLCDQTSKRYPSLIQDNSWPLKGVYELLQFSKKLKKRELIDYIKNCIMLYKKQLQQMEFSSPMVLNDTNNSIEKVRMLLKPDLTILSKRTGLSTMYPQEKINLYLRPTESRDAKYLLSSKEKVNFFQTTNDNSIFALQQLEELSKNEPELDIHFTDANGKSETNRNIYFQYVITMFYYNQKYQTVLQESDSNASQDDVVIVMDVFEDDN